MNILRRIFNIGFDESDRLKLDQILKEIKMRKVIIYPTMISLKN